MTAPDTVLQALELALEHEVEYRDLRAQHVARLEEDLAAAREQIAVSDRKVADLRAGVAHWRDRVEAPT